MALCLPLHAVWPQAVVWQEKPSQDWRVLAAVEVTSQRCWDLRMMHCVAWKRGNLQSPFLAHPLPWRGKDGWEVLTFFFRLFKYLFTLIGSPKRSDLGPHWICLNGAMCSSFLLSFLYQSNLLSNLPCSGMDLTSTFKEFRCWFPKIYPTFFLLEQVLSRSKDLFVPFSLGSWCECWVFFRVFWSSLFSRTMKQTGVCFQQNMNCSLICSSIELKLWNRNWYYCSHVELCWLY